MKRFQNYIRDVIAELRKVTWPTREELKGSTITVIIFSLMCTAYVFLVDSLLGQLVHLILG
ncbi:MAG TPA: preprotein translocase subunit SecE [Fibrobacteria bacterium]|jgi:preprotein translocase subunit SecE|nr:preprotein translocase subunit SecE [Fibrobacteria bacterium]